MEFFFFKPAPKRIWSLNRMEKSWLDNLKIILVLPTSFSTSLAAKNEGRIKFNQSIESVVTQLPLSTELSGQKGFTGSFSFKQIGRTNAENFGNFCASFKRAMSGLHINFWKYFLLPEFDSQPTHGPSRCRGRIRGVATPAILCYKTSSGIQSPLLLALYGLRNSTILLPYIYRTSKKQRPKTLVGAFHVLRWFFMA